MGTLVLSVFPGIGLLDTAFEREGFCIVRGPDALWGGDVRTFHPPPGVFDGVIGGPPCQAFSRLRHIVAHNGYQVAENLIPEFERVVDEAAPDWFLMENVPAAPLPTVPGYAVHAALFNNRWTGAEQNRVRRFSFGTRDGRRLVPEMAPLECPTWEPAVMASGGGRPVPVALQRDGKGGHRTKTAVLKNLGYETAPGLKKACELQGLPPDFLKDAPFTVAGKFRVVGNGVPLPMGRAIARAVKRAIGGGP
jgi:DNA (cytosine-5)-methyltransferase 1